MLTCQFSRVTGPPYEIQGETEQWLVYVRQRSVPLSALVGRVAKHVAARPCAASLRVYGEASSPRHVVRLRSAPAAITLLDRCEAVGIFDSEDLLHDGQALLREFEDRSAPNWDEGCLLRAVQPRPVLFLHAGHEDLDIVCGRADAERLQTRLREAP